MKKLFTMLVALCAVMFCVNYSQAQWVQNAGPFNELTVITLMNEASSIYVGSTNLYQSLDMGGTWKEIDFGSDRKFFAGLTSCSGNLFAGTNKGIARSMDDGLSWTSAGLADSLIDRIFAIDTTLVVTTYSADFSTFGLLRSTDYGAHWTTVNDMSDFVRSFAQIGSNVFAGTQYNGVYISKDNGTSWTAVNAGLQAGSIYALGVSGTNLFASVGYGTRTKIYESSNNGASWTNITSNLSAGIVFQIVSFGANLYAGCERGIFYSTNKGSSWLDANTGFGSNAPIIGQLSISGSELFAGTDLRGLWRRPLSEFGINPANEPAVLSGMITVSPNPTTGKFIVHSAPVNAVRLSVLNILGERVLEVINPHSEQFSIDLSAQPSGVYFVRFVSMGATTIKLIVKN